MDSKGVNAEPESGKVERAMWAAGSGLLHELDTGGRITAGFFENVTSEREHEVSQRFAWLIWNTWIRTLVLESGLVATVG